MPVTDIFLTIKFVKSSVLPEPFSVTAFTVSVPKGVAAALAISICELPTIERKRHVQSWLPKSTSAGKTFSEHVGPALVCDTYRKCDLNRTVGRRLHNFLRIAGGAHVAGAA